ncbi:MAG: MBL fold metallo-hydrolase [Planctomycetes bacterium]|nr:MBL fold metallo-hydrolase [Planctomycetota bacterium]
MPVSVEIISVGTLSRNRFWNETSAQRPAHATTTLLRSDETSIIVDPALPPEILRQRLDERTGLEPSQIDTVFLTNFCPVHRRGLDLFRHATWLMHADEIEAMRRFLEDACTGATARGEPVEELIEQEIKLLENVQAAPDELTEQIHLFPTPGVTPGAASLLILDDERTTAVAGDAIINKEYFAHRQAFEQHSDAAQAVQAVAELVEIADRIIPGHDDWIIVG